ncbi:MAG TPA: ABC transporter substrate-binding protein [Candidatus Methylomirabilis sp.]|nr:ABC transporter substrate-binding protein [Candidatus Methylomirabilis sp.]
MPKGLRPTLLALPILLAATTLAAGPPSIPIGAVNSLTGRFAPQGTAIHRGIVLAVEEANAGGGIGGRSVRLLVQDDEGRPERALAAAERLAGRDGAVGLVGGYVDSLVGPVSEVAERYRVPYVATASLDERLTERGYRFFFRVSSLGGYVEATVGFLQHLLKPRAVALLSANTPGASQLALRQREGLRAAGIAVLVEDQFTPGLSDFAPLLSRVRAGGAPVLVSNAFFGDHLVLVRQLRARQHPLAAYLGTFGMEFPEVIRELGPASEGLFGTTTWEPGITAPGTEEASRAFVEAFQRRFGEPPAPLAMHGYAGARALLAALAAAPGDRLTGPAVREALARVDLMLPIGRVAFTGTGDPQDYRRVVLQIQDGRHVVVYPPDRATGPPRIPTLGEERR